MAKPRTGCMAKYRDGGRVGGSHQDRCVETDCAGSLGALAGEPAGPKRRAYVAAGPDAATSQGPESKRGPGEARADPPQRNPRLELRPQRTDLPYAADAHDW